MQIFTNPPRAEWRTLTARPSIPLTDLEPLVIAIMDDVAERGDAALLDYAERFDKAQLHALQVSEQEFLAAENDVAQDLKDAIHLAISNVRRFHEPQFTHSNIIETQAGVSCWRKSVPIQRVGLYIPGGTAPLFSTVMMLGVPADIAACPERVLCTPPSSSGTVHPAILVTARAVGIRTVFKVGGAQAIAAMTFGTETIPKVDKIFGPGNQYVTLAKQIAQRSGVAIDMPAGPSEVAVLADDSCIPAFVAADLLSQAEHGKDSQVILITTSKQLVEQVLAEIEVQLRTLPREGIATEALDNSRALVFNDMETAMDFANEYAAEHLIIACEKAEELAEKVVNAGSVFLGNYSPEAAGDYASGTNHTLPNNGYARAYSGVSVDSFVKKITFQHLTQEGIASLGAAVERLAEAEGLAAHKNAITVRRMGRVAP
ncbi:MAG: histidinol dehydrogenase [Candidatus Kapaibacterium sp.]|nr:MAG: histidinol dehydrogenase [Candidatus Kapabacteria bacterium]